MVWRIDLLIQRLIYWKEWKYTLKQRSYFKELCSLAITKRDTLHLLFILCTSEILYTFYFSSHQSSLEIWYRSYIPTGNSHTKWALRVLSRFLMKIQDPDDAENTKNHKMGLDIENCSEKTCNFLSIGPWDGHFWNRSSVATCWWVRILDNNWIYYITTKSNGLPSKRRASDKLCIKLPKCSSPMEMF